jgi:hypothetical protein
MKKLFTLVAVLFSIASFAADKPGPRDSKISISKSDRSVMYVKIDGKNYDLGNNSFVLDNLRAGNHSITIYKTERSGFRTTTQVVYNNNVRFAAPQHLDIDISRSGRVQVKQTSLGRYDRDDWNKGNDWNKKGRDDRYGRY